MDDLRIGRRDPMNELMTQYDCDAYGTTAINAYNPKAQGPDWFLEMLGGTTGTAGVTVNSHTAMGHSPVWTAISALSGDIGQLTIDVKQKTESATTTLPTHPVSMLLNNEPNDYQTPYTFRETMMSWALGWGNAIAWIRRDPMGRPIQLRPLMPDRTFCHEVAPDEFVIHTYPGRQSLGDPMVFFPEDVFHIRGLAHDGYWGRSAVNVCKEVIGGGMALQRHGNSTFENGAKLGGIIKLLQNMKEPDKQKFREDWYSMHGGPENSGKTALLNPNMEWVPTSMSNEDAQWLEARELDRNVVASIFLLPPFRIGIYDNVRANIEAQWTDYVRSSLGRWGCRWEQEAESKLLRPSERTPSPRRGLTCLKTNYDTLTKGNAAEYATMQTGLVRGRVINRNEARENLGYNPVPGGDEFENPAIDKKSDNPPGQPEDANAEVTPETQALIRRQVSALVSLGQRQSKRKTDTAVWIDRNYETLARDHLEPACQVVGAEWSETFAEHVRQFKLKLIGKATSAEWFEQQSAEVADAILGTIQCTTN